MEIVFKSKKLRKIFSSSTTLSKNYGNNQARKIVQRLNEFKAAESLNDIKMLIFPRLHLLQGNLQGYWAVDVMHPFRIILEPLDGSATNLSSITKIKIIEIKDYH